MTKLSVNVNKLATLRNSRGGSNPDLLKSTLDIIAFGAEGITVHPRPDERHIRKSDVYAIAEAIEVEFNIEGYPDESYLNLIKEVRPAQCTLVPDPPHVLTSNAGWELERNESFLADTVRQIQDLGIRTSLFVDPYKLTTQELRSLEKIKTDRVELYTEAYALAFGKSTQAEVVAVYKQRAAELSLQGIELNAGHDLSKENLKLFIKEIPNIKEVSIGHALICDALYLGLKDTIEIYLSCLR